MNTPLKPCTCGNKNITAKPSSSMVDHWCVWCYECHIGIYSSTKEKAIAVWNTRANTPESSAAQGAMGDEYLTIDGIDAVGSIQLAASYVTNGNVSTILAGQLTRIADYLSKVKRLRPSDGERAAALREAISAIDALQRTDSEVYEPHWVIENRDRFNGAIRICVNTVRSLLAAQPSDAAAQPHTDYEALEREHFGDAEKQTGIYHPDNIAREKQEAAQPSEDVFLLKREIHNLKRHIEDYCPAAQPVYLTDARAGFYTWWNANRVDDADGYTASYLSQRAFNAGLALANTAQGKTEQCPTCRGNDADAPCAYPSCGMTDCLRDKRLAAKKG